MSLPRLPYGSDIYVSAKIKDSGVYIDWNTTSVDVYIATDEYLTSRTVVRAGTVPDGDVLNVVLSAEAQQRLNIVKPTDCKLLLSVTMMGKTIAYKIPVITLDPDINEAEAGTPDAPVNIELSVGSATTSAEILRLLAECKAALAYLESNEAERITSEAERNAAELERARRWAILSDAVTNATSNANAAALAARNAASDATAAAQSARESAGEADKATAAANDAAKKASDAAANVKDGKDGERGPQGEKGDKGDTGATGPVGPQGPALTYDDLTDAQKAELKRPAVEAAEDADRRVDAKLAEVDQAQVMVNAEKLTELEGEINRIDVDNLVSAFGGEENITQEHEVKSSLYVNTSGKLASGVSGYKIWIWHFDKDTIVSVSETINANNTGAIFTVNSVDDLIAGYTVDDLIVPTQTSGQNIDKTFKVNGGKYLCISYYVTTSKYNLLSVARIKQNYKKYLKILSFGNSFSQDAFGYVPFILESYPGVEVTIGIGYIGGSPLAQHCANLTEETQTMPDPSGGADLTYTPSTYAYIKYYRGEVEWKYKNGVSADTILADEDWDIVTFQQGGKTSFLDYDVYFKPFISKIHKAIYSKVNHNVKIGWLLTPGSYTADPAYLESRWRLTAQNTERVLRTTPTEFLLPYGTAIAIARTTSLASLGDDGSMMEDHIHLQEGIPALVANYTTAIAILKELGVNKSVVGDATFIDEAFLDEHAIPGQNRGSGIQGMNAENRYIAQQCAIQAIKYPYGINFEVDGLVE